MARAHRTARTAHASRPLEVAPACAGGAATTKVPDDAANKRPSEWLKSDKGVAVCLHFDDLGFTATRGLLVITTDILITNVLPAV